MTRTHKSELPARVISCVQQINRLPSCRTPSPVQSAPRPIGDTPFENSEDEHSSRQTCDGGALPQDTICESATPPALPVVVTEIPSYSPPAVMETPSASVPPRLKIDVTSSSSTLVNTWAAPVMARHRVCRQKRAPRRTSPSCVQLVWPFIASEIDSTYRGCFIISRLRTAEILQVDSSFPIPIAQAPSRALLAVRARHVLVQDA